MNKIRCVTNLDLFNEKWPDYLPSVPCVGDFIRSAQKWDNEFQLTLEVYSVTWAKSGDEWIAIVELHIQKHRKWSISEFYNWYAPKVGRSVSYFI